MAASSARLPWRKAKKLTTNGRQNAARRLIGKRDRRCATDRLRGGTGPAVAFPEVRVKESVGALVIVRVRAGTVGPRLMNGQGSATGGARPIGCVEKQASLLKNYDPRPSNRPRR